MPGDYVVQISNLDEIKAAFNNYPKESAKYFSRAINASLAIISKTGGTDLIMQFKAPRSLRTGLLQSSFDLGIKPATVSNLSGSIGPTVEYAKYVEFGTVAHLIQAINKKVLANEKTGQIFGRTVHHPGTKANPFMERILAAAQPEIDKTFEQALNLSTESLKV